MSEGRFYVYVIFRPTGAPCYVGKGFGRRWEKHEWRSTNPHLANIIKDAGGKVPKVKLHTGLSEETALAYEVALIAAIGREVNGGPLVNMTDGGEGTSGHKMPAETVARIAALHIGNKYRLGMKASDETKAKLRDAKLGRKLSAEHREKIGAAQRGKKKHPGHGARVSAGKLGKKRKLVAREFSVIASPP